MNGSVHSTYYDVLDELVPVRRRSPPTSIQQPTSSDGKQLVGFCASIAISLILCSAMFYYFFYGQIVDAHKRISELSAENNQLKTVQAEVDLIKKILSGIVPTINQLEAGFKTEKAASVVDERVQVMTTKAALREVGNKTGKIIAQVDKGTILLVTAKQSDWVKVETPLGKDGWVSRDEIILVN